VNVSVNVSVTVLVTVSMVREPRVASRREPHGAIDAEWMRAPTNAWCQVRGVTVARDDEPPQLHSHVQPVRRPVVTRLTRGWWCAMSVRGRVFWVMVIGVSFPCAARAFDVHLDDLPASPLRLCSRRHSVRARSDIEWAGAA
jgi:hypothetical protein